MLLLLRDRGIWQRLRSAPLTKSDFLVAKTLATMIIDLFQTAVIYAAAMAIFGVRISGSVAGFVAIAVVLCFLNAPFGLRLAALGRSAPATRGIAVLVTLLMVMIGCLGALIRVSPMAAASLAVRADAVGGGWLGRHDMARPRP